MKILVTDTNVFIDLIQTGALAPFLDCPFEVCTTDLVVAEITTPVQQADLERHILGNKIRVLELSEADILAAIQLPTECNLKRITDKSVLLKAVEMQACLLTGDRDLRKEGARAGLEVRGSLWAIREIWLAGLSDKAGLLKILDALSRNARLPKEAMESLRQEITDDVQKNG